ncbi:MAG TPA: wax ester/triacylglycerol synthase family O-acyltransferase [Solirubrobacterales bacterium]
MAQRHMDRLTSFDTSFLANEKRNGHMAIGAVMICEGSAPDFEDFTAHIRSRLHQLPRFRQRVVFPPLQLGRPFWVDFPEFDLEDHVRHETLPAPGTDAQFHELVGRRLSPPLDRSKPLWELCLVDGFEDDRFGIVYKTHHALADGISAVDIGILLFDVEPKFEPARTEVPWQPEQPPSRARLAGKALTGFGATFGRLGRWLWNAFRAPRRAAKRASDGLAGLWEVTWALTKPAPKTPLNVAIGPDRCFCWMQSDLDDFKQIKNRLGGTVNDVSLAVTAGALRRWLQERDVDTDGLVMRALVPVSVRAEDEHGELGNRLTAMRGPLPVHIADPLHRLHTVAEEMDALKASKQALGAEAIWGLNDWFRDFAPPLLLGPTAAINFSTRLFNMLVTNFPGPQMPFFVLGRELIGVYPVGFLAQGHAMGVAILSYNGKMHFGLLADRDTVGDLEPIARYIEDAIDELRTAAAATAAKDPAPEAHRVV